MMNMEEARKLLKAKPPSSGISEDQALSILKSKPPGQDWSKLIGQNVAKGVTQIPDFFQLIGSGANPYADPDILLSLGIDPDSEIGRNLANPKFASEYVQDILKETGVDLNSEIPQDAWARAVARGSQFAGGAVGGNALGRVISGGAKSLLSSAPSLAKTATLAGTSGATSSAAQELGVNPWVADIGAAIAVPSALSAAKSSAKAAIRPLSPSYRKSMIEEAGKEMASDVLKGTIGEQNIPEVLENIRNYESPLPGYQGLTAEVAPNVGLSQLQNAKFGHVPALAEHQAVNNELIKNSIQNVEANPDTMKSFAYRETPEQAGSAIRHQITKNIEKLTKERNAVTKPLYQELKEYKPGINPIKAQTFIENELKDATGMTKKSLLKIKEMIKPEPEKINLQGLPPKAIEQIREQGGGAGLPSALKLKNAIEEISDMIGTANKNNARKRANKLREVKDSLLEDLINTPQSKADLAYSKLSEPISEITRNKRLDKAGKKDIYNKSYITESDASAKTIIGRAMKSDEFSDNFLKQFGDHPQTMKSVHGYINDDLITNVMDKNGRINLNELHSWKLSNPNANKLYPNFDKKIHDLQKKGLIDKLNEHLEGDKNITYDKMDKYMKNNRAMLNETFDENQLKVLEGSRQALAARHRVSTTGRGPGSPTASNLTILQSIEQNVPSYLLQKAASGSLTGKAGIWIYKFFQNAKKSKANELLDAALRDKDVAELLLTHVKDGKKAESIITRIKKSPEKIFNEVRNRKSLISPIMGSKKKEEED